MSPIDRPSVQEALDVMDNVSRRMLMQAVSLLDSVYAYKRHEVVSVLRTFEGIDYVGVHVAGSCGRSSVCAEGVALGAMLADSRAADGLAAIEVVVSVLKRRNGQSYLIEPCGVCAELITDYAPDARVWTGFGPQGKPKVVSAFELIPAKRGREW